MTQGADSGLSVLAALVATDVLSTAAQDLAPFESDHRQLYRGKAWALARPRTTAEVAAILAFCNSRRIGVVPVGGNTSYCGGATPDESGRQLVLSLARLNRIRAVDAANNSLTAEAGCVLASVQEAAAAVDRYFPLSLGAEGSCQIGGNLSTNAGGLNVLRYGMARDLVLGLEVVLADGRVLETLSGLRKDNTGYDLKSLFVGAEGTLGVITAASLKLFPAQHDSATAFVALRTPADAVALLSRVRDRCGEALSSFELIPAVAVELVRRHLPDVGNIAAPGGGNWLVLIEVTTAQANSGVREQLQATLADALAAGLLQDALLAQNSAQRARFWRLRESIPAAQARDGASLKHDISLPVSAIPEFIARGTQVMAAQAPDGFLVAYGHLGDGNLHFNINQRAGTDRASFVAHEPALKRAVHDLVREFGGSFSAEHGIGRLKVDELARYAPPVELALMSAIKQALDPNGIMNPGKVLRHG
jgi:FAD/FMN-containing dehydrogenase